MKTFDGIVVSNQPKTAIVEIITRITHPLYKKIFKKDKRFKADTSNFAVSAGDRVRIGECRRLSKDKYFKVLSVLKKGVVDVVDAEDLEKYAGQKKAEDEDKTKFSDSEKLKSAETPSGRKKK